MTLDTTIAPAQVLTLRRQILTYTGPASYVSGGDPYTAGEARLSTVYAVFGAVITNGTVILLVAWDAAAQTLKVFDLTGAEVAGGTNLSTYTGRLEFVGI